MIPQRAAWAGWNRAKTRLMALHRSTKGPDKRRRRSRALALRAGPGSFSWMPLLPCGNYPAGFGAAFGGSKRKVNRMPANSPSILTTSLRSLANVNLAQASLSLAGAGEAVFRLYLYSAEYVRFESVTESGAPSSPVISALVRGLISTLEPLSSHLALALRLDRSMSAWPRERTIPRMMGLGITAVNRSGMPNSLNCLFSNKVANARSKLAGPAFVTPNSFSKVPNQ